LNENQNKESINLNENCKKSRRNESIQLDHYKNFNQVNHNTTSLKEVEKNSLYSLNNGDQSKHRYLNHKTSIYVDELDQPNSPFHN
jgi:hypothetical protein